MAKTSVRGRRVTKTPPPSSLSSVSPPTTASAPEESSPTPPLSDELAAQVAALSARVAHLESLAHTDHTLSAEVIEQIARMAVSKMVAHLSTLLKMGDTLLSPPPPPK